MDKSKVKILVVDDEEDILEALQTHLEMDGFYVEVTPSAKDALERIRNTAFHIVLSDINMPEIDGIEMLEEIKKIRGHTIVIMITAYTSMMKVLNSQYHGATDYVLKPFRDVEELSDAVNRAYLQIQRWDRIMEETLKVKDKGAG